MPPPDADKTATGHHDLEQGAAAGRGDPPIGQGAFAAFGTVAAAGQISALTGPGPRSGAAFLASCAALAVVLGLAGWLRRRQDRSWLNLLVPHGYVIALGLLLASQKSVSPGLQPLVLLPMMWVALYHPPRQSATVGLAAVGMLAVSSWALDVSASPLARMTGVWAGATTILLFGTHTIRRWLSDAIGEREEALRQARILGDAARELNSTLDPDQVVGVAVRLTAEVASPPGRRSRRSNYCQISDATVTVVAEFDAAGDWVGATWPLDEHPHLARAVRTRRPTWGALDQLGPTVGELNRSQAVAHGGWVPIVVDGELHGVLAVAGRNRPVSEQELARCVAIGRIMELALTNALAHQRARQAALTDPLTALVNRRGMTQLVRERRGSRPLVVLAIDVDGLKEVNDHHGHATGDELIVRTASAITAALRAGDVVARVGGDEFTAILFGATQQAGLRAAARMLRAVLAAADGELTPSVSIGVAHAESAEPFGAIIRRADAALYQAKHDGGMRYKLATAQAAHGALLDRSRGPGTRRASRQSFNH